MRIKALTWALTRLVILLPIWLLGLVLFVLGLALSPWGTAWLLEQGQSRGWYSYERVEGAPLDRLVIEGLELEAGPATGSLARLELAWAEDCVLSGRLCLDRLAVEGLDLALAGSDAAPEPEAATAEQGGPAGELQLPFPIELRELRLDDVDIRLADGTRIRWETFATGAEAEAGTFRLLPTTWSEIRVTLPLSPGAALALPPAQEGEEAPPRLAATAIDASIALQSPLPAKLAPPLEAAASLPLDERERLTLPEIRLPLTIKAPRIDIEDLRLEGAQEIGIGHLGLALYGEGHEVRIEPFEVASDEADATLGARVELRDDYPLEARLSGELYLPERMPALAGEEIDLALDGSLADLNVRLDTRGPVAVNLEAHLDALDPTLPFEARLEAESLRWPLADAMPDSEESVEADAADGEASEENEGAESPPAEPYRVENLRLSAEGSLLGYRTELRLDASGPQLPETGVTLTGEGDLGRFAWQPLALTTGDGALESRGEVRWGEELIVDARVSLDDLDPGAFTEAVQGRLSGDAELRFEQSLAGWRLEVPSLDIDGELQELPLSLQASLAGNSEMRWRIDRLALRQGDNRLDVEGRIDERLALEGELEAPALQALSPELDGLLRGDFALAGTLEAPQLELALQGDALRFADNRLDRLTLTADVSGLEDPSLEARLEIDRLVAGGQRLERIDLALDGRLSDHRLTLEALAGDGMPLSRAMLALEGSMNAARTRYQGKLSPLELDTEFGDMRLDQAIAFAADLPAGSVRLEPFCLRREQGGALCVVEPLEASADRGRAVLTLRELPMAMFAESVPEGWTLDGESGGDIVASWGQGGSQWSLDADLSSGLALSGEDAYGQPWSLPESRLELEAQADQQRATAELRLSLAEAGRVVLEANVEDPQNVGALDGRLRLEDIRLVPYRRLAAGMETLRGAINGEVAIGGDLSAPSLDGDIRLAGLRLAGDAVPLAVSDGELNIALSGDRGRIQGFIAGEEGRLDLSGNAAWPSADDWQLRLDIDGQREPLLVTLPNFGRLRVAPDLRLAVKPSLLQVRGRVEVPWARLEVGQIPPSAVSPSGDEIIITEEQDREAQQAQARVEEEEAGESTAKALAEAGMAVDVRIDLILGPDMHLEAYGLESDLRGSLEVRQQSGPVQLFGDVNLVDGRFRAYGQDLTIREGRIIFSGPAGQPLLQLEAIRNPGATQDDVIAGLRVTGPAEAPNLEVFSEPAMNESRALSYLLRGRAPEDGDNDGALTSALIGLSLSRTGGAVGQLGQAFGVDDLALETAGSGEDSQVVVSGQLTDDLQVSYGVGIFSPIAELTLRYTLWRNLYLQAVSGAAQAVDLIYGFSLGKPEGR